MKIVFTSKDMRTNETVHTLKMKKAAIKSDHQSKPNKSVIKRYEHERWRAQSAQPGSARGSSDAHVAVHPVERGRRREVDDHGRAARAHRVFPGAHHAVPEPRLGPDVHVHRQLPARPLPLRRLLHVARQRARRRPRGHVDPRLVHRRLQEPRRGGAREVLAVIPHPDLQRAVRHLGALVLVAGAQGEVERARQRAGRREVEPGRGSVVDGEEELRRVEVEPDQDDDDDDGDDEDLAGVGRVRLGSAISSLPMRATATQLIKLARANPWTL
jgi:hypothetical protein